MSWKALALVLVAAPAVAQTRPLLTEPATTAASGSIVLETGEDFISAEPNFVTGLPRDRFDGPLLRLVFSPADRVEMDLEWVAAVVTPHDPAFGSVSDAGDVSLRAKVRLVDEAPGRPCLSARFAVSLPETKATQGLGPNTLRMQVEGLVSKRVGRITLHGNAGFELQDEVLRPASQRDFLAYGLALGYQASHALELLGEVAGRSGKGMPGADARSEARLGARLSRGRIAWDAAVRRGLAAADGRWGVTAGLAWTLRRPAQPAP